MSTTLSSAAFMVVTFDRFEAAISRFGKGSAVMMRAVSSPMFSLFITSSMALVRGSRSSKLSTNTIRPSAALAESTLRIARRRILRGMSCSYALGVDGYDPQVLHGHALVAHVPGHLQSLVDAPGRGAGADGARGASAVRLAVRALAAVEVVALHHAREALALARADHVHEIARVEHGHVDALAYLMLVRLDAHLVEVLHQRQPLLSQVPSLGLRQVLVFG